VTALIPWLLVIAAIASICIVVFELANAEDDPNDFPPFAV
jgi:hypothetical protein